MRADRLVAVLLALQAHGRVTAASLAEELEVSVKTARRDLEALAIAGVPVYSQPGRGGGWSLLGGARTDLSGLTASEARALFLIAGPASTVAPSVKAALHKLVQALPETFRADARAAASAVVLDPVRWGGAPVPMQPHLEVLQHAVIDGHQVRISYLDRERVPSERTVHPLGLAQKGSTWYLVADTDRGLRSFRVSRVHGVTVMEDRVVRPAGFDLAQTWRAMVATIDQRRRRARATVRAREGVLPMLRAQFGDDVASARPESEGSVLVEIWSTNHELLAEQLAGWGSLLEVTGPDEVRSELARIGAELVERYATHGVGGSVLGNRGPLRGRRSQGDNQS